MVTEVDAVVVGAGINGMVAAAELAMAGWSVALLERNPRIGGFIDSAERTLPGYTHDTYSSWHPLFVSSPAYAALGDALARHGLTYRNVKPVAAIEGMSELNIGHSIVARAIMVGFEQAVREMKQLVS